MIMNSTMISILQEILDIEPEHEDSLIEDEFISDDAGVELIEIYANTEKLKTRELITDFMKEAGYTWLRKLITRDTRAVASGA